MRRRAEACASPKPSTSTSLTGLGVRATVEGRRVEVGSSRAHGRSWLDVSNPSAHDADRLADEGKSPLYAPLDGRLAAMIAVSDPVKEPRRKPSAACMRLA
jgi:Au+-exporting ATPase